MKLIFLATFLGVLSSTANGANLSASNVMKNSNELPPPTPGRCLPAGAVAPDFQLTTVDGQSVTLSKVTKTGPVVLVFYRGGWCPFCNLQLQEYNREFSRFQKSNLQVVAISADKPDKSLLEKNKEKYAFPVASDSGLKAIKPYNLSYVVNKETEAKYRTMGIDLEKSSGRKDGIIAVPAIVIVDKNQKIKWCYANEDYKVRPSIEMILQRSQDSK